MEYPTWGVVSKALPTGNVINPDEVYGNTAFVSTVNPKCSIKGVHYEQELVGIDIPVLLKPSNANNDMIVILGESPLRNDKNRINGQNIIFGLPYAVHMDENSPTQSKVYKKIFNSLMDEGYSIYLTDIKFAVIGNIKNAGQDV